MITCPMCGTPNRDDRTICYSCEAALDGSAPVVEVKQADPIVLPAQPVVHTAPPPPKRKQYKAPEQNHTARNLLDFAQLYKFLAVLLAVIGALCGGFLFGESSGILTIIVCAAVAFFPLFMISTLFDALGSIVHYQHQSHDVLVNLLEEVRASNLRDHQ